MTIASAPPTLRQRITALAGSVRDAFGQGVDEKVLTGALKGAEPDYALLKQEVQGYLRQAERIGAELREFLAAVEALERLAVVRHGPGRADWEHIRDDLTAVFQRDVAEGYVKWKRTFAAALAAWQLDFCGLLLDERFPFSSAAGVAVQCFRRGLRALDAGEWRSATRMVSALAEMSEDPGLSLDESTRARLLVLLGRILVRTGGDLSLALAFFERACRLMSKAGFAYSALAEYHRARGNHERAHELCQKAINLSPAEPDGYVGVGLWCENNGWWEESDDWYAQAVRAVWGVAPVQATEAELGRLLAPTPGNLLLQAARMLSAEHQQAALHAADRAIALGINGSGTYPARLAYMLKGEVLESMGDRVQAAEAFYEAGKLYSWRGEQTVAIGTLERAVKNNDENVQAQWRLADALLVASYSESAPFRVDQVPLNRALETWHRAFALAAPAGDDVWAYLIRSRIHEQQSALPGADRRELYWQAVALAEIALLSRPRYLYAWTTLARLHRLLDNELCALQAAEQAVKLGPENAGAWEERTIMLTNTGRQTAAARAIRKWRSLTNRKDPWAHAVRAHILLRAGGPRAEVRYWRAIALSDEAAAGGFEAIWYRIDRARLYRRLGQPELGRQEYTYLWRQYETQKTEGKFSPSDDGEGYGWAGLMCGHAAEAADLLTEVLPDPAQDPATIHRNLGLCRLALGAIPEAEQHLKEAVAKCRRGRDLDDWVEWVLSDIEPEIDGWPQPEQARGALGRFREQIEERRRNLNEPSSAGAEIRAVIFETAFVQGHDAAPGAFATEARLSLEEGRPLDAAQSYARLCSRNGLRAEPGVERALDLARAEADEAIRQGRPSAAVERYREQLELLAAGPLQDPEHSAALHARMGYAYLLAGDDSAARLEFTKVIEDSAAQPAGTAARRIAGCKTLLGSAEDFWRLDAWLGRWGDGEDAAPDHRRELAAARSTLLEWLSPRFKLARSEARSSTYYTMVTQIAVEVGRGLAEQSQEGSPLFETYLPEMRARMERETGVVVPPGIRIRDGSETSELDQAYIIMLDEVPLVLGRIRSGRRYYPHAAETLRAAGIGMSDLEETAHPLSGAPGYWVAADGWEKLAAAGLGGWQDPPSFMVSHLEAVLRRHLALLLDLQAVQNLLAQWSGEDGGYGLVDPAMGQAGGRKEVAGLLRALARERVPITRWRQILETLRDFDFTAGDETGALAAVRLRIKDQLAGVDTLDKASRLPADLEQAIAHGVVSQGRKRFLAILPERTQEALSEVRELVGGKQPKPVLLTGRPELRPFVRRLVELEFPDLAVLSEDEAERPLAGTGAGREAGSRAAEH